MIAGELPVKEDLVAKVDRTAGLRTKVFEMKHSDSNDGSDYVYTSGEYESSQTLENDKSDRSIAEDAADIDNYIREAIELAVCGQFDSAQRVLLKAERKYPENLDMLYNMAMLQMDCGRYAIAYDYAERFLESQQISSEMLSLQGYCRLQMGDIETAESKIAKALSQNAKDTHSLVNMAIVLLHKGQHNQAVFYAEKAIAIDPASAMGHITLANIMIDQGNVDEGIDRLEMVKGQNTCGKLAGFNLSFAYFSKGDRRKGYEHYEYRYLKSDPILPHAAVAFDISSLTCYKSIALLSEQGFGDTVQFCRYAKWLAKNQRFSSVMLYIQEELVSLIRRSLPDVIVRPHSMFRESSEVAAVPLLSCPYLFGENAEDSDLHSEYLTANEFRRQYWDKLFSQLSLERCVKKIALVWQGNPQAETTSNRGRSLPLNLLEPIARRSDVTLVGLQKGFGLDQYYKCEFREEFVAIQERINSSLDFEDTIAILACCDLLITVDTAVAHIAGAMGLPVWLLLSYKPDWRWGGDGKELFWYRKIRSFKQRTDGDWGGVVQQVLAELAKNKLTSS